MLFPRSAAAAAAAASDSSRRLALLAARRVMQPAFHPARHQHQIFASTATTKRFFSFRNKDKDYPAYADPTSTRTLTIIPGASSASPYGSLGEPKQAASPVAWQAAHNADVQRVTQNAMIYELTQQQSRTIEDVVPWFLGNMPAAYFRQVPDHLRMDHIKAIAAIKDANMDLYLNLKSHTHDGRLIYTFIRPGTEPGTLLSMVEELPYLEDIPLTRLHVFSSLDGSMSLNMFVYGHKDFTARPIDSEPVQVILKLAKQVQEGNHPRIEPNPLFETSALQEYLKKCSDNYLNIVSRKPERFLHQRLLFDSVSGTEGCEVRVEMASVDDEDYDQIGHYWIDVAVANSMPQVSLEHLCRIMYLQKFDVARARLDVIDDGDNGSVTLLRVLAKPLDETTLVDEASFDLLMQEIKRSKWLDNTTMDLVFDKYPWLGVRRGEIITAMCSLMHPVLAKENPLVYSKANILHMVTKPRMIPHAAKIAELFLERFNPENPLKDETAFAERRRDIQAAIESDVEDSVTTGILNKMLDIVSHTLKTNIYMQNRYALGLRLDPRIMGDSYKELPYGILFAHGRRFNGYHVRFRDISRGGMRLVTPATVEQYTLESARHYDECYGLAFAQQLKNKDIPEGGSKAVNLIDTNDLTRASRDYVMRKAVKGFTDTILDLVVDTPETQECIVDYLGKKEVLYLGPDEQVIPEDINWIIQQAARRGYTTPAAFMSSKPRAGINHKEYGVTSEGVNVYLDVALRRILGKDPTKEPFTIKMTGGPDGDVGGNEIKILIREYGDNAKIVGIADHSGCAEDPEGLNHEELLRLFHEALCISNFNASKLGSKGVLHTVDTEEGVKARNSMHNRLEADAFIPCGGRPNTIDIANYKQFIKADGTPSSPLIVEGANLFVTAEARKALHDEAGVIIVKDSSANKGGVITSSYEICAAMLLSEDEFFEHKEQIVEEVLAKVRGLAKLEAELLFREGESYDGALPEVSQIISNSINAATDALSAALDTLSVEDREQLLPLFRAHLPKTLADLSFDRVHERVPDQYVKNAISSTLASKMVYKEGTKFIEAQPKHKLAAMALRYIQKQKEVAVLMESLNAADMPEDEKQKILNLLDAGGARTALQFP
jgi:glutamate dehydrogenase